MQPHSPHTQQDRLPPLTAILTNVPNESRDNGRPWTPVGPGITTAVAVSSSGGGNNNGDGGNSINATVSNSNANRQSDIFARSGPRARSYSYGSALSMNNNAADSMAMCSNNLSRTLRNNLVFSPSGPMHMQLDSSASMSTDNYMSASLGPRTGTSLRVNTPMMDMRRDSMMSSPTSTNSPGVGASMPAILNSRTTERPPISYLVSTNTAVAHVTSSSASASASQLTVLNRTTQSTSSSSSLSPLLPNAPSAPFPYNNLTKPTIAQPSIDRALSNNHVITARHLAGTPSNLAANIMPFAPSPDAFSAHNQTQHSMTSPTQLSHPEHQQRYRQYPHHTDGVAAYIHSDGENLGRRTSIHSSSGESSPIRRISPYPMHSSYVADNFGGNSNSANGNASGTGSVDEHEDPLLTEKRRRNARASARFRDRRKQREREMRGRCEQLEQRVMQLEALLNSSDVGNARLEAERWRMEAQRQASRACELEDELFRQRQVFLPSNQVRSVASSGNHLKRTPESP
ncbi:hypothetical protein BDF19DRAFT_419405 [Syncephalis fuscata]|nr:hypothetical protein BDF19DRAFT_419405 [Syncephalis fuscata]